jgi:hypothetical protein
MIGSCVPGGETKGQAQKSSSRRVDTGEPQLAQRELGHQRVARLRGSKGLEGARVGIPRGGRPLGEDRSGGVVGRNVVEGSLGRAPRVQQLQHASSIQASSPGGQVATTCRRGGDAAIGPTLFGHVRQPRRRLLLRCAANPAGQGAGRKYRCRRTPEPRDQPPTRHRTP